MIKSFKHKKLERLHTKGNPRGLNPDHIERIEEILAWLDSIETPDAMNLPSYRLPKLRGQLQSYWSVRINANWRIIFEFENGNVLHVDMLDYH